MKKVLTALDLYLFSSFMASLCIWGGFYYVAYPELPDIFSTSLLVMSFYFATNKAYGIDTSKRNSSLPLFFVFQIFSFMAISFYYDLQSFSYAAIIPFSAGTYYRHTFSANRNPSRGWALLGGTIATYFMMASVFKGYVEANDYFTTLFMFWTGGTLVMALDMIDKKKMLRPEANPNAKKNRLFFHDIINQTHGINLFLDYKLSHESGVEYDEIRSLSKEIKTIQYLIKDHFGYGHRDIEAKFTYVTFNQIRENFFTTIKHFLNDPSIETHFNFSGWLDEAVSFEKSEKALIHYPSFYRIITNIVKNIYEEGSHYVEFNLDYSEAGLNMVIKNKITNLKDVTNNLAQNLENIILLNKKEKLPKGLGLESIYTLCHKEGGSFSFKIEGDFWVNSISLPCPYREHKQAA